MDTQALEAIYQAYTGAKPEKIELLTGSGSNRRYYRLAGLKNMIGVYGTSPEENKAFFTIDAHFKQKGIPVPEIYAISDDEQVYLQEDLGDLSLFQAISSGRTSGNFSVTEKELLQKTIKQLPRIQFEGAQDMDFSVCYPIADFNHRSILWDLNYFKYCFLKTCHLEIQEDLLENDFENLASKLLQMNSDTFMYRDFQSRNVMINKGEPYFIDFQGGRKGPYYYDVTSFLWQAKANFPQELRQELLEVYLQELKHYISINRDEFYHNLRYFVFFRTLQVLGAYGFRGYFERKTHFLESIPFAMANLAQILQHELPECPYLNGLLHRVIEQKQMVTTTYKPSSLTVKVMSFSFKKGIPEDESGNGGGYVFDCRAIHNPGKYEQYKQLTGLDKPVIEFLEKDGEISSFLQHVDPIVDAHVQRFMERNFTNLSICFGCTGGQHRSVYSAEHVAQHIHKKFGVKVHLIHREQQIDKVIE